MKTKNFLMAIAVCLMSLLFGAKAFAGLADCAGIATGKGAVTGVADSANGVCIYRGIPYAAPPVGALRFVRPQPHAAWAEPLKAEKFGNQCVQFEFGLMPSNKPIGKEDCLYLNVWQPASAATKKLPVMVWVHGGGFVFGSGSQDWYESANLATKGDVVVVTFNYRLGPFGFLTHPALKDSKGRMGNYGFADQIAALQWVKKNIGNFGGDAGNVTIFGQSAGGMSVGALMISPAARGLFQKAIVQSGPVVMMNKTMKEEMKNGLMAGKLYGCEGENKAAADCLRGVEAYKALKTAKPVLSLMSDSELKSGFPYHPVVDGDLIPDLPAKLIANGKYDTKVIVMAGTTKDEASMFTLKKVIDTPESIRANYASDVAMIKLNFSVDLAGKDLLQFYPAAAYATPRKAYNDMVTDLAFTCPTRALANMLTKSKTTVYLYYFSRPPSAAGFMKDLGAFHGAELPFIFGNFMFMGMNFDSPENRTISSETISLWSTFARDGKPSAKGVPTWTAYNSKDAGYMHIDVATAMESHLKDKECAYIEDVALKGFAK